jgi:hypothetical protein
MVKTLMKKYERKVLAVTAEIAVEVAKQICIQFSKIKKVQPGITGIWTGMGTWDFQGNVIAFSMQDDDKGEEVNIDVNELDDIIRNINKNDDFRDVNIDNDWYSIPSNSAMTKIVELLDFYIETDQLNCSTWQHGFNEKGVVFEHSETSDQNNPFSIRDMEFWKDTKYYKTLIRAGVPVTFKDASNYSKPNEDI